MQAQITHEPAPPPPPATVTITMSYDEAVAMRWLGGYCATASRAIQEHTLLHGITPMTDAQRQAVHRAGTSLWNALRAAGVKGP